MRKKIGIIGFGNFAQFIAPILKPHFDIVVTDKKDVSKIAKKRGVRHGSMEDISHCEIILFCVPAQNLEHTLKDIRKLIKPGTICMDVCSVKEKPVRLMKKIIPKNVRIIGTHPLFGPQSGKNGIKGLRIVVCPVRGDISRTVRFFKKMGLEVLIRTPKEHDKEMANVQALTHFVARALKGIEKSHLGTKAFEHLLEVRRLLEHDSLELFRTIENENPYAKNARERFKQNWKKVEKTL